MKLIICFPSLYVFEYLDATVRETLVIKKQASYMLGVTLKKSEMLNKLKSTNTYCPIESIGLYKKGENANCEVEECAEYQYVDVPGLRESDGVKLAGNGDLQFNMAAEGIREDLYFSGAPTGYTGPLHADSAVIKLILCFPKQFVYKLRWRE